MPLLRLLRMLRLLPLQPEWLLLLLLLLSTMPLRLRLPRLLCRWPLLNKVAAFLVVSAERWLRVSP